MKKLITISLVAFSASAAVFADGVKNNNYYDAARANKGFYAGAGLGLVWAAENFKKDEAVYLDKKPKASNAVVPSLLVGYRFNEYLSADVNGQYRKFKYEAREDGVDEVFGPSFTAYNQEAIKNYSLFLNGYINIPTETMFTPYLTAGLGYARNEASDLKTTTELLAVNFNSPGKKTNNFAWNAGLGTKMKLNKNFDLDLGYRYVDLGKVKIAATKTPRDVDINASSQKLKAHEATLNLIYNF